MFISSNNLKSISICKKYCIEFNDKELVNVTKFYDYNPPDANILAYSTCVYKIIC